MKFGDHRLTGMKNKSSLDSEVGDVIGTTWLGWCQKPPLMGVEPYRFEPDMGPIGQGLLLFSVTDCKYCTHSQAEQGWAGLRCFHVNAEWSRGWDKQEGVKRWPLVQEGGGGS